jgi:hypothetical protein
MCPSVKFAGLRTGSCVGASWMQVSTPAPGPCVILLYVYLDESWLHHLLLTVLQDPLLWVKVQLPLNVQSVPLKACR